MFLLLAALAACMTISTARAQDEVGGKGNETVEAITAGFQEVGSFSNEYLEVKVNDRGQFVILTTGGDPNVQGDEDKVLMYPESIYLSPDNDKEIWSSYTTFRRRTNTDGLRYIPTHHWELNPRTETNIGSRSATTKWVADGCSVIMVQTLEFMRNPFTHREDMVRIEYTTDGVDSCGRWETHRIALRLMMDTMIGDNDHAPFLIEGIGKSSMQHDLQGDAVPKQFRVFESDEFATDSLQAMGLLLGTEANSPLVRPDRFVIANWGDAFAGPQINPPMPWDPVDASVWEIPVREGQPHGDSAIAIYWPEQANPHRRGDVWAFGYGLAPQGGGAFWTDAVRELTRIINFSTTVWVNNTSDHTYSGGTARLILPSGLGLAGNDATTAVMDDQIFTQSIGDVPPGGVVQVSWQLEATGGPGTYEYTTAAEFTSGEQFTTTNQVTVLETIDFEQSGYTVVENAGAFTVTVQRFNAGSGPITVNYSTAEGTASANSDYTPISGTLSFAAGETSQILFIPILNDTEQEEDETIVLTLTDPVGGAQIAGQGEVTLTILEDEGDDTARAPASTYLPLLAHNVDCRGLFAKEHVWTGTLAVSCDAATQLDGRPTLKLHAATPSIVELYSPLISVTPNTTYAVSYRVKTDLTVDGADLYGKVIAAQYTSAAIESDAINQNRIDAGFGLGESVGDQTDWTTKSYTFTTSPDTAYVRLRGVLGGPVGTASGSMWLSDVHLQLD
jgi:hypothetical protein